MNVVQRGRTVAATAKPDNRRLATTDPRGSGADPLGAIAPRIGVDVSRYFITLNAANAALPGTTASDTSFGASLSVAWVM
jgi:hypothetical protein